MTDENIHDLKTAEADANLAKTAADPRIAECEARAREIIDPLAARLAACSVHVASTVQNIAQRLYDEPEVTNEQVIADITSAVEGMERANAEAKAAHERAEAEAKAEERRRERLATATIILPAIFEDAPDDADRAEIVAVAVDFADALIAATAK